MKILLLRTTPSTKDEVYKIDGHDCIEKTLINTDNNYFIELKNSAKFAEEKQCDNIVILPPGLSPQDIILLLRAMPDQDIATSLIVPFNISDKENTHKESHVITMLQLLTGEQVCGFRNDLRIYPTKLISNLPEKFFRSPFVYLQILINASKAGYKIQPVEYSSEKLQFTEKNPPPNSFLIKELLKSLIPFTQKRLCPRNFQKEKLKELLLHPKAFLKYLLQENATPGALAMAAGVGMFVGTLPIFSLHTVVIIYISIKLRLNKMLSVNMQHLCMPPFIPIACIEIGHYMLHGTWLKSASFETMFKEINSRIFEWVIGSLVLAPLNALVFAGITYMIAMIVHHKSKPPPTPS